LEKEREKAREREKMLVQKIEGTGLFEPKE